MNFVEGRLVHEDRKLRIDCKDFEIPLPLECINACKSYMGQPVAVGYRPENVRCETTDAVPADAVGRTRVVLEQSLGSDTLCELEVGNTRFTARVDARPRGAVSAVTVGIDPENCRLFDAKTGDAIGCA